MEQQKLPNSTLILIFGIVSIVLCCCYGVGVIFGTGYKNVTTGKILSYIGIALGAVFLGYVIYMYATYGIDGMQQMNEERMRELGF